MYLRFTTQFINPYGEIETGIFRALEFIRDNHSLASDEDINKLKNLTAWFNGNLEKPVRFSNATNKNPANVSLSWFKDSAHHHIQKMHELIQILESYGVIVERVTSKKPGYIVFEDEFQVSAMPFKTDRKKVI